MTEYPAPVSIGDVFVTLQSGEAVVARNVDQRKPDVWSVAVQPVDQLPSGEWVILTDEPIRWTSIKADAWHRIGGILAHIGV